jgi:hypothetical protein
MWSVTLLTLFPEMFPGPLGQSLAGKANEKGLWDLKAIIISVTSLTYLIFSELYLNLTRLYLVNLPIFLYFGWQ